MNFFFSSSYGDEENTKSYFKNKLPPIPLEDQNIVLKSVKIHNVISLNKNLNIPHFKSTSKNHSLIQSNIWRKETGSHISINDFTLTIKTENPSLINVYEIHFHHKTYKTNTKFIHDLNELLKKIKSGSILIFGKKITLNSKYYKVIIKCSDKTIFKALGLSSIESDEINVFKSSLKGKNKISFRKEWVKYFYLNFNEINSINDLVSSYNNLIKSLSKEEEIEEIFSINDSYLNILPIKNENIQFNFKILSRFCKMNKSQIKLNGDGYGVVLSPKQFPIKKKVYPKLIKIFSPNVLPTFTQSNNNGGLIGVFPYKIEEDYYHEILNNFNIRLYNGIHSHIKFVLCNEKNEKINFSSGTSTLLHCQLYNNKNMTSNKFFYFNSSDKKSLNLFPDNTQSNFSQIIDGDLNCSDGNHLVALQSIFIPHKIHNLPSSNFNFSMICYNQFTPVINQIYKSDHFLEDFPTKYYDENIFFEEMKKKF